MNAKNAALKAVVGETENPYAAHPVDIIELMMARFDSMSKSQKRIATYIMDHYDQAVFMTAAQLGRAVDTSESTTVRFAMSLGFEGYPEFQKALEVWVKSEWNSVAKVNMKYGKSTQSEILTSVLNADIEKIADTLQNVDVDAFDLATSAILAARKIYIVGIRTCEPLADFLHFYLSMIRQDVINLKTNSMTEVFEQMIHVGPEDVVIGISFPRYSMRTLKAMEFANDRNAKVITITDTVHSPMSLYSSCNLCARSDMVSIVDSLVAPLSLINALVVALCLKVPDQVTENLKELEQVWGNYQVNLNDEIEFANDEPLAGPPIRKKMNE
ncbi:MAG: MurR/RpiR family transcriptional regulator [Lachnospiraceae bacterium]|nr:MurR/RpiR family transcriptional regulator [Lachnospiraceae bacterium]